MMDPKADERQVTAKRIKYHREQAGLTQKALANRAPGHVTQSRVSEWESGKLGISAVNLAVIARALGEPSWLFHVPLEEEGK